VGPYEAHDVSLCGRWRCDLDPPAICRLVADPPVSAPIIRQLRQGGTEASPALIPPLAGLVLLKNRWFAVREKPSDAMVDRNSARLPVGGVILAAREGPVGGGHPPSQAPIRKSRSPHINMMWYGSRRSDASLAGPLTLQRPRFAIRAIFHDPPLLWKSSACEVSQSRGRVKT
jgi:hypothetical protein